MLKKQIITLLATLTILASGGCISMAIHNAYQEHHPPAPTTTSFEALRQMKTLKIEVVDDTKEKHINADELARALVQTFNKERAITNHSHVTAYADDAVPCDAKLSVHLTAEYVGFNDANRNQSSNILSRKISYRSQFFTTKGALLSEKVLQFNQTEYLNNKERDKTEQQNLWSLEAQKKYQKAFADEVISNTFVY